MVEELSPFHLNGKYDHCTIGLAKWSLEIGSIGSDAACWITLTNLPLHCWSHGSTLEIVRPVGTSSECREQLSDFLGVRLRPCETSPRCHLATRNRTTCGHTKHYEVHVIEATPTATQPRTLVGPFRSSV